LHRTRRWVCTRRIVSGGVLGCLFGHTVAAYLASPLSVASPVSTTAPGSQPRQTGGHPWAGRPRLRPDDTTAFRGQTASSGRAARPGLLQAARQHAAADLAGGVVL